MLTKLAIVNRSSRFWLGLILVCVVLELTALFYQYVLGTDPCVLCVQIRAWVLAVMLAGVFGLLVRNHRIGLILANLLALGAAGAMAERAYVTLGTERGFVDGTCGMNPNFPAWLKLDEWLPAVFKALESCGYTPWVIPEWVSMAEVLMGLSVLLVLVMLGMLVSGVVRRN